MSASRNLRPGPSPRGGYLRWSIVVPALVLGISAVLQGTNLYSQGHRARPPHLALAVSGNAKGWSARDVPIGANEFLSGEAEKILNYDEVLSREYVNGGRCFGVYVAYWGAGKMPTRFVADHTPDRCWSGNGWNCLAMKFRDREVLDGVPLQPAQWRLFEPPSGGKPIYVLYWHLVEGRVYEYGERFNAIPDPVLLWKDAVQQAVLGSREQYFIRLTSPEPFDSLWNDPGFADVVRGLTRLGLALPRSKGAGSS